MTRGAEAGGAPEQVVTRDVAARLADIRPARVTYWVDTCLIGAAVDTTIGHRRHVMLDFTQLMSVMVAAELRRRDVTLPNIRRVVDLVKQRGYDSPLSQIVFANRGRELYFLDEDGMWEGRRLPAQGVMPEVLNLEEYRVRIRRATERQDASRGRVEKRRGVMGSKPVFAETRVPVATVLRYLEAGKSEGDILRAYPTLSPADVATARASA